MQISIANAIQVARRIGAAAAEIITTNLKMWLGFETSETLGREEVVNGDFATDSDWTEGVGWDIDVFNNKATCDGSQTANSDLEQAIVLTQGSSYQVKFDLIRTAGILYPKVGNTTGDGVSSSQSVTQTIIAGSSNKLELRADINFIGSVTNVSVKELTQITPDKSGNNNVGELFTGKALDFSGSTDKVDFAFTTPVKSAVFWVKPLGTGLENILTFGGAFAGTKSIRSNSNVISSLGLSSVSVYVNGLQSSTVPLNQWSRVVVNFALLTPSQFKLGFAFNSYGDIQLSDVQLYNENLSADDIAYDYANPQNLLTDRDGTSVELTNLKGYWHLSEGAGSIVYDSSGGGNNGTIIGATYEPAQPRIPQLGMMNWAKSTPVADEITLIPNPTIPTQDILGNAVRDRLNSFNLDGSGYAANETLPTISGNISLSFWVKLDTFVSGNLGQVVGRREGSSWLRVYRPYASHLRLEVASLQQYTFPVTENQWVYVAITINSSNQASVYVDDSAVSGATLGTSFSFINTEVFTVGAWLNPALQPTSKLNGLVSDVLIYDRVLTSGEVEKNYNAGLSAHTND